MKKLCGLRIFALKKSSLSLERRVLCVALRLCILVALW
jgi:hypothetical protein